MDFVEEMRGAFERAGQAGSINAHRLTLADVTLRLEIVGPQLEQATLPALAHLSAPVAAPVCEAQTDAPPEITFCLWDGAATGVQPPRSPFAEQDYQRYGRRAVAHDGVCSLMHAPNAGQLFAYDRSRRRGYYWVKDAAQLTIYERAAPLQTLFHWALQEFGWQIVHAAGVGNATGGVLLIGSSGAGKSTTALSCLTQDRLHFLSDDKCLVRLAPEPRAFALYSSAKLKVDMLTRLPHFHPLLAGWDHHDRAGKGLVFLHPTYADHMLSTFPIKALLLPQVTQRAEAALHPVATGDVFRQLGPSTVIWLPGAEADNFRFTAALARGLPCRRLELATDLQVNATAIQRLIEKTP